MFMPPRLTAATCAVLALALLLSALPGQIPSRQKEPAATSDLDPFTGTIKEVSLNRDGAVVLVERGAGGGMDRVSFCLGNATPVTFSDKTKAKASDLKAGQRVTV